MKSHELIERLNEFTPYEEVRFYCPINELYYYIATVVYCSAQPQRIYLTAGQFRSVGSYTYSKLISGLLKYTTCFDDINFIDIDQGNYLRIL